MGILPLPPASLRRGSPQQRDDDIFYKSACRLSQLVIDECSVTAASRILDFGCGSGRLLYGLVEQLGSLGRYVGVDVDERSIRWLSKNIEPLLPWARFIHSPYANDRYNPRGDQFLTIAIDERFDAIVLFSVFTHMQLKDLSTHLKFMRPILDTKGSIYLSVFVENDVPDETENPDNYLRGWSGPLHCVLFNRTVFERTVIDSGYRIAGYNYRKLRTQSCYRLEHVDLQP